MFAAINRKKKLIDAKRPFPPAIVKNLKAYYDVEWTYNSNAIEGNTLTLTETKVILEDGITVGKGKSLKEHLEVINHKEAIDYVEEIVKEHIDISERVIKDIHSLILKSIDNDNAGKYRNVNVMISGSKHTPPDSVVVPEKMTGLVQWYEENKEVLHPIQLAAEFHHRLVHIHPFVDGNGRTARLLMNLVLMRNGFPPAIIQIEDRLEYMEALEKASVKDDVGDFIGIVAKSVESSLDTYMKILNINKYKSFEI